MSESSDEIIESAVNAWMAENKCPHTEIVNYRKNLLKKCLFITILSASAIIAAGLALTIGTYPIGFIESYEIVYNLIMGIPNANPDAEYLIHDWRLPRVCTGLLAGAGLGAAGAVMQSILRNPLADPYTTGISSGASFGAALTIGLGIVIIDETYSVVLGAFIFSLIPTAVIILVSKMKGASPTTMIMAGIAIMYIFNAFTSTIKLWISAETLQSLYLWSVGSIEGMTWGELGVMAVFVFAGVGILIASSRKLNVLSTGDESSRSIGVNANRLRVLSLLVVSVLSAGVVSFTGLIGFVGMVSPHICRLIIGSDNRFLIPSSAAFGALLVIIADAIGRTMFQPSTLPVGVVTAFIGGPLFLYLIIKQKKVA